jgi:hypothetical protein
MNMAVLTDKDPMPFGAHKGKPMEDVPASYLDWLMGQDWIDKWPQVVGYVENRRQTADDGRQTGGKLIDAGVLD